MKLKSRAAEWEGEFLIVDNLSDLFYFKFEVGKGDILKEKKSYGREKDLALSTWVKLARAHSVVNQKSNEDIRNYGLTTPQFGVLEALGHLGPLKVGELCKKMLVSGGNMTLVLDNMERQGLIERAFSKTDRRAILIKLTAKGSELFDKIFVKHAEYIESIFSVLTQDEQKTLGSLLKKLGLTLQNK